MTMQAGVDRARRLAGDSVRRAFTLIELLVVIAVIGLLVSLILPSLGGAKRSAWNVLCQNNLRQLGMATQMYLDEQKDPVFFNLNQYGGNIFNHIAVWDALQPFIGNAGNKPFECPAARGLSSVRVRDNVQYLAQSGGRFFVATNESGPMNPIQVIQTVSQADDFPFPRYTEYWFNDSNSPPGANQGVSGRKWRLIKFPQYVVVSTDALDEFPRHQGAKANPRTLQNQNTGVGNSGKNNFLFGDQAVKMIDYSDYQDRPDPAGAPAPFYNWGHYYPN